MLLLFVGQVCSDEAGPSQASLSGLSSDSGMYKTKRGRTCNIAPAHAKSESLSLKAASPLSFHSHSSLIQGQTHAPKGSVEPEEPVF